MPRPSTRIDLRLPAALMLGLAASFATRAVADGDPTGEQIYRQRCASCHGAAGEGTPEDYPHPLIGDKSPAQLAKLIAKTMPSDDPGTCVGEDADKVAAYVHETFYSPAAQARNKPPRVELARLTVRQYRNSLADLIGTFRDRPPISDRRGLRGEYFKSRRFRDGDRQIDRTDPVVRFDFGEAGPDPDKFLPHTFSIRWTGSVIAPESGEYEFIVRTEHSARLWVNRTKDPLIDAWVKSGNDTEYRGTITLLAGRAYPLRLEFAKGKQGESDNKKDRDKPPPVVKASISLEWKRPGRAAEAIPERDLSPDRSPEAFVATAPFPPDDRSVGYERGTSVSRAWDEATTEGAIEAAAYVSNHLRELSGVSDDAGDRSDRLREFAARFVERAFRRPLTDEQKAAYVSRHFERCPDPAEAIKRVVLLTLKSPRFLYGDLGGDDPYAVASRLALGLWDSLPDAELLEEAKSGRLKTRAEVARQADRMLTDLRTKAKLREFFHQWLRVEPPPDLSKDAAKFPGFDEATVSDLRTSLDLFLEDVVWGDTPDFRRLLLADDLYLNGRLSAFYGAGLPPDAPFQKVKLESGERAGLLSHPYLLAAFAYNATTSPIHRGVFVARGVLGRALRPPPEAFTPLAPDVHPDLTTRQRVSLQTSPQSCIACHGMINPLGFALERFDAVGRYRTEENGRPVDAKGAYQPTTGEAVEFEGARGLAAYLAGSDEVRDAFVRQVFHHLVKQPLPAFGPKAGDTLNDFFAANGYDMRKLMVEIVTTTAVKPPAPPAREN